MYYALVTGTDHGLGPALVKNLLQRGYFVIACRLNPNEKQIDELLNTYSQTLKIIELDIGNDASVQSMKEKVCACIPHLDLLITRLF